MKQQLLFLSVLMLACAGFLPAHGFCRSPDQPDSYATIQNLSASLANLAFKVRPSVVQIRTIGYETAEGENVGSVSSQRGTGSGVILDSDGYIITNAHVVKGSKHIEVWLNETNLQQNGNSVEPPQRKSATAHLIGLDDDTDLALIKIDRTDLVPLPLADSDLLRQGQLVMAFGNPMALENSVTLGVISSSERQISPDDPSVYIQTDAPINPGNSGGPLVDAQGRLAGINTFILSKSGGSEGIGFAIPSNVVKRVYDELRKAGHIHHGHIGIRAIGITPPLAAGLELPRDWGVVLEDVEPGGPSDEAGLQPGDLVTSADGQAIRDLHHLLMAIDRHSIGDEMRLTVLRGSDEVQAKIVVQERPDDPNRFLDMVRESSSLISSLGILAIDVSEPVLKMISELRKPAGVLVAALVEGPPESEDGLAPGDLIVSLNNGAVANTEALRKLLDNLQTGTPVVLQIQREDQLRFVALEMP